EREREPVAGVQDRRQRSADSRRSSPAPARAGTSGPAFRCDAADYRPGFGAVHRELLDLPLEPAARAAARPAPDAAGHARCVRSDRSRRPVVAQRHAALGRPAYARSGQGGPRVPDRRAAQGPRARASAPARGQAARQPQPDDIVQFLAEGRSPHEGSSLSRSRRPPMIPEGVNIKHPDKLFIGGEWVAPMSGSRLEIVNPNSEEVVARTAEAGADDMDRAVAAAREAFDHGPWPTTPPAERGAKLMDMIAHLEQRVPELSLAWTAQVGGLASFAPIMHGGAVAGLRGIAALGESFPWVTQQPGQVVDTAVLVREPVGVVVGIAPWNAPFGIMANKVFYALIAGCPIIVKPSPETPLEAYILAEAAEAAGLPPGTVSLVPADREPSAHLIRSTGIDKVSFTGASAAGMHIASVCGAKMTRCTMELGGKSAAIVRDDFPIEAAAGMLGNTITVMSGQVCAMLSRAIVSKHRHDE